MTPEISDEEKKEFLKNLVSIYSPTGEETEVANFLVNKFQEYGIDSYIDDVGNVIAKQNGEGPKILRAGHMDTVTGKIPIRVEKGDLWGRGSVDAKGSLATFFFTLIESNANLMFASLVEEEGPSKGAKNLDLEEPDYIINGEPSGWDGVTIGYKGTTLMKFEEKVERFHSSIGKKGAAEKLIEKWQKISRNFEEGFDTPSGRIKKIEAYEREHDFYGEMIVNIRTPSNYEPEIKGKIIESLPAYKISRKSPLVRGLVRSIRNNNGKPKLKKKTGTADMNILGPKYGVDTIAYGPGNSDLDHTPNEHLNLREYLKAIETLKSGIKEVKKYNKIST